MYKTLRKTKGKKNEDQVYSIKEILDKIKNKIKNLPENKVFIIEGNEKIINIVKRILYFNSEKLKNEIRQLLYSLYKSKKILQINSIKFDRYYLQMKTIFMNSENSKTNVPHTFKLN